MQIVEYKEDRVWEQVLEALSMGGRLARMHKLRTHELNAIMKLNNQHASGDLARFFVLTQLSRLEERDEYVCKLGEHRTYAMLYTLIRCMKCWVETESPVQTVRQRWRIAHS